MKIKDEDKEKLMTILANSKSIVWFYTVLIYIVCSPLLRADKIIAGLTVVVYLLLFGVILTTGKS